MTVQMGGLERLGLNERDAGEWRDYSNVLMLIINFLPNINFYNIHNYGWWMVKSKNLPVAKT